MAFAPDYAKSGRFYVYYTDRDGRHPGRRVPPFARPARADPGSGASCCASTTRSPTTTAASSCSAPTASSTSALATAAAQDDPDATARTSRRCSARSSASTRARRRRRLHDPARQPVRRPAGRPAGDLRLRAAQPVAVLVRPRDRRAVDRRRRPERVRGGRLRARAARAAGPTSAGRLRGRRPLQRRPARAGRDAARCSSTATTTACSITGGYVVRDPRLPSLVRPLPLRRLLRRRAAQLRRRPRAPGDRRPLARGPGPSLSSFGTDDAGHLYATSLDGRSTGCAAEP